MRPGLTKNRIIALFLLALLLFNPPILTLFDKGTEAWAFGLPLFYAYLFGVWAVMIGFSALIMRRIDTEGQTPDTATPPNPTTSPRRPPA